MSPDATTRRADAAQARSLQDAAVFHLQNLLRCDTQSPPGNERIAAEYIAGALADEGIDAEILESAPGRASVVARLRAENPAARPVLLMGHIDVVTVERDKWERDPFGGELIEGYVWGRGAVDMKGQVAAELAAFIALKRAGVALTRDVIFVAFADEEAGGAFGADWVWKNHQDLIDAEFAINEGGGTPIDIGEKLFYTCQVGEKGGARLKMTVRGEPGHASVPQANTAMEKLGEAMKRLHAWEPPTVLTTSIRHFLEGVGEALDGATNDAIKALLAQGSPSWTELAKLPLPETEKAHFRAITRNTAVPTIIHGGKQINVIPSEVIVEIDGRILPGADPEDFRAAVQEAVGDVAEITFLYDTQESGIEADPASSFFEAIKATMAALQPDATVVPSLISGGTDAGLVPGIKVYGFFPILPTERVPLYDTLVHGHNERVHVDDIGFGTRFIYDLVVRVCGG
ncbi:MAG TPA: M20/M25/M40 family metallo-hydrolase [Thermomicrobiales bacterium]|nr:M20/M25/M40 family metallo-hydrolase [Thermomicrobiales bacterium]